MNTSARVVNRGDEQTRGRKKKKQSDENRRKPRASQAEKNNEKTQLSTAVGKAFRFHVVVVSNVRVVF